MKALVLHNPKDIRYEEYWPQPAFQDGWVIVKIQSSGICGSDLPRIMQTGAYHHPTIVGHEFSGTVYQSSIENIPTGAPVAVLPIIPCGKCPGCQLGPFHCRQYDFIGSRRDGGFAEYCAVPAQNLFILPPGFCIEEGALIEPLAVTLHVLRRSGMEPGQSVLVFGAGAIGILIAQWAMILGAGEVAIADIREESLETAAKCGIQHTLHPSSSEMKATTGSFDHVFEAAGSTQALLAAVQQVKSCGSITIVGRETKDIQLPIQNYEQFMRKELTVKGCWGYNLDGEIPFLYKVLQENRMRLSPLITHRISLEEGPGILQQMWEKAFYYCKVMFQI